MDEDFIISKDGVLKKYKGTDKIVIIPDNVNSIKFAFFKNTLEEVYIGKNVKQIIDSAFSNCEKLKKVHFNDKITLIGEDAFYGCKNLEELDIPDTVKEIKNNAFISLDEFKKLNYIHITSNTEKVGLNVFYHPKSICEEDYFADYKGKIILDEKNENHSWEDMIIKALRNECLIYTYLKGNLVASDSLIKKILSWLDKKSNKDLLIKVAKKKKDNDILKKLDGISNETIKNAKSFKNSNVIKKEVNTYSNDELLSLIKSEHRKTKLNYKLTKEQLNNEKFLKDIFKTNSLYFFEKVLPQITISDKEFLIEIMKHDKWSFAYADDNLKNDYDLVLELVRDEGLLLKFASKELQNDKTIVLEAIKNIPQAITYASENMKDDKEIVHQAIKNKSEITYGKGNNGNLSQVIKYSPLKFVSDRLKNDKETVMIAVSNDGNALEFASEQLKSDKEIVLKAVDNNGYALKFASDKLKDDEDVVLTAVIKIGNALEYASDRLKNNKKIVLASIKTYYGSKNAKIPEMMFYAYGSNNAIKYASQELKQDEDVIEAVKREENKD